MNLKRNRISSAAIILVLTLIITCIPFDAAFAAIKEVDSPARTNTFSSSDTSTSEYCRGTVDGSKLHIQLRTVVPSVQFRVALYGVNPKTEVVDLGIYVTAQYMGSSTMGKSVYGFEYTIDFAKDFTEAPIPDGEYFLYISQLKNSSDTYEKLPSMGALYKNLPIIIEDGMPSIPRYDDIIKENDYVQKNCGLAPSEYLDKTMEDVRFLFVNPKTNVREEMNDEKVSYMKRLSDRVTAGAYNDYDKLLKIYEYAAGNFYYDTVAFSTHSYQYANPYQNMYNCENKIASDNSDNQGRVATTCQGFSGIYLALARAQGIPTRLVYGHRAASPTYNWNTEGDPTTRDHWWAESYVNGRWIFVDPTTGTNNRWNRTTNAWQYYGVTNYTYFDPSKEQFAVSHISFDVYRNNFVGYLVSDSNEISKLTAFLETRADGVTNGKRLNKDYVKSNKKTWGDGIINNFYGDGKGRIARIRWNGFGLSGAADFSGFSKMKYLYLKDNDLTSLNLKNNTEMRKVEIQNNQVTTIDLTNCKKLTSVLTEGNQLQEVKIYANKRNTTISSGENGYIYITYTKVNKYKLRTFFRPDIGYTVGGFYNAKGKKLTTLKSYSMNPVTSAYNVVFEPDPDSFKYELRMGSNTDPYRDYNQAAQKRLRELGYYNGTEDGIFDSEMKAAVELFQTEYNIEPTGIIDETTWSVLFNPDPQPIVDEDPIPEDPVDTDDEGNEDKDITDQPTKDADVKTKEDTETDENDDTKDKTDTEELV